MFIEYKNIRPSRWNKIPTYVIDVALQWDDLIFAGGALRSLVNDEDPKDFDLFAPSNDIPHVKQYLEKRGAKTVFTCPNGDLISLKRNQEHIQLISKESVNSPLGMEEASLIDRFDFTVTVAAMTKEGNVLAHKDWLRDTLNKELRLHALTAPVSTLNRIHKYRNKGFRGTEKFYQDFVERLAHMDPESLQNMDTQLYID